jgi:hypothetical protein
VVEAELAGLAASGAATLVALMVSEAWTQARQRVARFLTGRGGADAAPAEEELRVSRGELVAARAAGDEAAAADVEAAWRTRLRRTLRADPGAAAELRALLDELAPLAGGASSWVVHNTISGEVRGVAVQSGNIHGGVHIGPPPASPSAPAPAPAPAPGAGAGAGADDPSRPGE